MKYFVYILESVKFDKSYVGITDDLDRRIEQHNSGQSKYTKKYAPWFIVHYEQYNTRAEARKREKYLKSGSGREWMKKNIKWSRSSTE